MPNFLPFFTDVLKRAHLNWSNTLPVIMKVIKFQSTWFAMACLIVQTKVMKEIALAPQSHLLKCILTMNTSLDKGLMKPPQHKLQQKFWLEKGAKFLLRCHKNFK